MQIAVRVYNFSSVMTQANHVALFKRILEKAFLFHTIHGDLSYNKPKEALFIFSLFSPSFGLFHLIRHCGLEFIYWSKFGLIGRWMIVSPAYQSRSVGRDHEEGYCLDVCELNQIPSRK